MNDPIKIIYKYKNDNKQYQYLIYIYVGDISNNLMKILEKIKDVSLIDMLRILNKNDMFDMINFYGMEWYKFFYNKYHINKNIDIIIQDKRIESEIVKKFGLEFYEHLKNLRKSKIDKRYSYNMATKRNLVHHEIRIKKMDYNEQETDDYHLMHEKISTMTGGCQIGGEEAITEEDTTEEDTVDDMYDDTNTYMTDKRVSETDDDEYDQEELEKLYSDDVVPTKEIEKATSLIQKVLNDKDIMKKKESKMIKFDTTKDANMYRENLSDVHVKNYIKEQYILKDDTIKTIKNKICASIKNNPKFGKKSYIIPSRQYLWSEYIFKDKYDKLMIGSKWTQRNELLNVDVEPNENIKMYDELRDPMKKLRDDMRRFNSNIRRIDEENTILADYIKYVDNNELYLLDIYNELGKMYHPTNEELTNLIDTYIKIYYPRIQSMEIKNIIDYLNESNEDNAVSVERDKIISVHEAINIDLIVENKITMLVEKFKTKKKYTHIMKDNYITQSMINLYLHSEDTENFRMVDLFRIFDDLITDKKYPFIQFLEPNGHVSFKFDEEEIEEYIKDQNMSYTLSSWFQNINHGISFKIRTDDMKTNDRRFITVNLNDIGRLDYKIQWKEDDHAKIDDISKTYKIIDELVGKINNTTIRHKFDIPKKIDYNTAFITAIQHFTFDNNYKINHNDLSKFARYFFPYLALVIEPRKRISKIHEVDEKSKFGTYLRYKRISNYENSAKIEQRIYYYMRNYEFTEKSIIDEICKQFNITQESAEEHLRRTMQKYSHIKKARKELKKFDTTPKYKSPGIDIAIQGKTQDKYKIRISGARDKEQMNRIVDVLNILLYLYMETYLAKKSEWQYLKNELKQLINVAERRHSVMDYVKYSDEKTNIKAMADNDKKRIGYKPEKGQSHYTRVCQNSGKTQRRRPQQFTAKNIDDMLKQGYKFNKATGMYERKLMYTKHGKKQLKTIRAVKLNDFDEEGNAIGNEIYYTCSPEQNGIHMYVGFLTKSKNPNGEVMPCCFKKDQYTSQNESKRNFFLKSLGKEGIQSEQQMSTVDQLYILQDTNKIMNGRFGYLPKILDFYLNDMLNLKNIIAQHYLNYAPFGYFFKYGIEHGENSFISAISVVLDMTPEQLLTKVINKLTKDKNEQLFTALNNGDIKTYFKKKEKYIGYLKNIKNIDSNMISHILTIPRILTKDGLNIIIFSKIEYTTDMDQNEMKKSDCQIICQNNEELVNLTDTTRENILLFTEHKHYYPIFNITKKNKTEKDFITTKTYSYENKKNNIIEHIREYCYKNCMEKSIKTIVEKENVIIAKNLYRSLIHINDEKYNPIGQYIDNRNKCRFLITKNGTMIPVSPSGSIYELEIIPEKSISMYHKSYNETIKNMNDLFKLLDGKMPIKPFGVNGKYVDENTFEITAIIIQNNEMIPIKRETQSVQNIQNHELVIDTNISLNEIDRKLQNYNKEPIADDRVRTTNYYDYYDESYELFRFHISDYINKKGNENVRDTINKILNDKIKPHELNNRNNLIHKLRKFLYKLIDSELVKLYSDVCEESKIGYNSDAEKLNNNETGNAINDSVDLSEFNESNDIPFNQDGGKYDKFIQLIDDTPNLDTYKINNNRELCSINDKNMCSIKKHCKWNPYNNCLFALTRKMAVIFVNKLSIEIIDNEMKRNEVLQENNYFVSNVVDKNRYTERPNQKVIKGSVHNIKKGIANYFGTDKMSSLEKKRKRNVSQIDDDMTNEHPIKDFGNRYMQNIVMYNNTILRAYTNSFYWLENKYQDVYSRNLGYYSQKQTELTLYFRSMIINWMIDKKHQDSVKELLHEYTNDDTMNTYIVRTLSNANAISFGYIEYHILNQIHKIPIVIYVDDKIITVFDKGIKNNNLEQYEGNKKYINIQYTLSNEVMNKTPHSVDVIYFK